LVEYTSYSIFYVVVYDAMKWKKETRRILAGNGEDEDEEEGGGGRGEW